jgi:hypothetical protein
LKFGPLDADSHCSDLCAIQSGLGGVNRELADMVDIETGELAAMVFPT